MFTGGVSSLRGVQNVGARREADAGACPSRLSPCPHTPPRPQQAPLVYVSSSHGINVQRLFSLILEVSFSLPLDVEQRHGAGEPLLEY